MQPRTELAAACCAAGDGVLDEEEFVYIMSQHGASETDAKNAWFLMCKVRLR
ncbi:hypothetical protein E2C01_084760 [Portunus trituberculatus]|uniref:EF-hand domain-containing protein n=1 Tax=Portunus trituberculatus TaxID=210409 RepID=A0A5B7IZ51_PORTR|nr:hypothetical protein [Portunus trituberculatus]